MKPDRSSESGSVLYWIFIAVALFGALSFAVARINRGGNVTMDERARLQATDIMQYAGAIQRGIRTMRINGVEEAELCFHAAQWGHTDYDDSSDDNDCGVNKNLVFNAEGGAISFQQGVDDWYKVDVSPPNGDKTWAFSSRYEVEDVGTTSSGSDTEILSADIIMATAPLKDDVCMAVNALLDFDPADPPAVAAGTYDALATSPFNTDDLSFSSGSGRIPSLGRERCVAEPSGLKVYYKVILAR